MAILIDGKVIGVRDRYGIRPLCLGSVVEDSSFVIASEESAFRTIDCHFVREISPGEVIVLDGDGIEKTYHWIDTEKICPRFCVFEFVYFARPDSRFHGKTVYTYREEAGMILAGEHPVKADMVSPVPDSGKIYSATLAHALGIRPRDAIVRNRYYPGRTFLTTRDTNRRSLQELKFYVPKAVVHEQGVIIVEDSIVRANAAPEIVKMLRRSGAREVHLRVGSAPITNPCYLGIDIPSKRELIAASLEVEEIGRKIIEVDSLGYLSLEGMVKATGIPKDHLCLGCFTGDYPSMNF